MLSIREQQIEESAFVTIQSNQIHKNLIFVGYKEINVGSLFIGEKLRINFRWTIETEILLKRMKAATNVFEILDLLEMIRSYDLYK